MPCRAGLETTRHRLDLHEFPFDHQILPITATYGFGYARHPAQRPGHQPVLAPRLSVDIRCHRL